MATVKLQNGNVILKDGKVSCSCCCQIYRLYPSSEYGVNFSFNDLPDTVQLDIPDTFGSGPQDVSVIFSKVDSPFSVEGDLILFKTPSVITTSGNATEEIYQAIALHSTSNFIIGDFNIYKTVQVYNCTGEDCGTGPFPELNDPDYIFFSAHAAPGGLYVHPPNATAAYSSGPGAISYDPFPDALSVNGTIVTRGERVEFDWQNVTPAYERFILPYSCFENNPAFGGEGIKFDQNLGIYRGGGFSLYFDHVSNVSLDETLSPVETIISNSCKWTLKSPQGVFTKTGDQNTPIGTYGPYSVT